jgi:imidazole glycerol-phosphate synthase subunit HisH
MIRIVDYGVGNVRAFLNVFKRLNIEAAPATSPADLADARKLILPGVGHFDHAMARLQDSGMRETLDDLVQQKKVPVLGICVGMQMLARASDEGTRAGLGWIPGRVRAFSSWEPARTLPLPHMGWNDVRPTGDHPLFRNLDPVAGPRFYFLHSYFFETERPSDVAAVASYGQEFGCAVSAENVHGVQFHPEKSHHFGTGLLKNFAEL